MAVLAIAQPSIRDNSDVPHFQSVTETVECDFGSLFRALDNHLSQPVECRDGKILAVYIVGMILTQIHRVAIANA